MTRRPVSNVTSWKIATRSKRINRKRTRAGQIAGHHVATTARSSVRPIKKVPPR